MQKIYSEEKLNFFDTQEITKLIIKKRTRRLLLNELNNYKNKNEYSILNDDSYDTINEIFRECLNLVKQDKDFETAKIVINLSNYIFRLINDETNEKICLINDLKSEKVLKNYEFWNKLIKYEIIEEIYNQKLSNLTNKKDEKININKIVVNKLNIYLTQMVKFCCRSNYMRQILEKFKDYYKLDEIIIKELNNQIDEYEKIDQNQIDLSTISTEKTSLNDK